MGTPYLGEMRIFSFGFAPKGWAQCNGQTMSISQNDALFALLGTTYGGNGQTTFALPNLQGRAPMHFGNGAGLTPRVQGEVDGEVNHTLLITEMPAHVHTPLADAAATSTTPTGHTWATLPFSGYDPAATPTTMAPQAVANAGGGQPHSNTQPYLALNVCIALVGIFPSRN